MVQLPVPRDKVLPFLALGIGTLDGSGIWHGPSFVIMPDGAVTSARCSQLFGGAVVASVLMGLGATGGAAQEALLDPLPTPAEAR